MVEAGDAYKEGEWIRKEGGGRKPLVEHDKTLLEDLEGLLQPKGDSMSEVQWTSKSLSHLVRGVAIWLGRTFFTLIISKVLSV